MNTLKATFQIVTPMFIGDANQAADDGIRPPSVKGALRFWWRALNWGRFRSQASCDEAALVSLHKQESHLFGAAASDSGGGQGCFLVTVRHAPISPYEPDTKRLAGMAYLAGLGLKDRSALPNDSRFSIILQFRPHTDQQAENDLAEVLRLLGLFGSLGSRTRRGFGSITHLVQENDGNRLPTQDEFEKDCNWLKSKIAANAEVTSQPFSAITAGTLFYRSNSDYPDWNEAMENVGKVMNRYRTNGTSVRKDRNGIIRDAAPTNHRIVGQIGNYVAISTAAFPFFSSDHNQVHAIASTNMVFPPNNVPPERSIFGIPHPYRFSSLNGRKVSFDFMPSWSQGNKKGRRASPLHVHIAAFANPGGQVKYRALLLLMPARFLPVDARLEVSIGGTRVGDVPAPTSYTPITNFLSNNFALC
jgi:CRISPR-associated protein Cmr1